MKHTKEIKAIENYDDILCEIEWFREFDPDLCITVVDLFTLHKGAAVQVFRVIIHDPSDERWYCAMDQDRKVAIRRAKNEFISWKCKFVTTSADIENRHKPDPLCETCGGDPDECFYSCGPGKDGEE